MSTNYVGIFSKVSFEQFKKDCCKYLFNEVDYEYNDDVDEALKRIYDNIQLPKRWTVGSAGYDFICPFDLSIGQNTEIVIPTGIRCEFVDNSYALKLYPRSGLGFKFNHSLANTVGVIDADYFHADNEGHITVKIRFTGKVTSSNVTPHITNSDGKKNLFINTIAGFFDVPKSPASMDLSSGMRFVQGVFEPYGLAKEEEVTKKRTGGFGSTGA